MKMVPVPRFRHLICSTREFNRSIRKANSLSVQEAVQEMD